MYMYFSNLYILLISIIIYFSKLCKILFYKSIYLNN